MRSRMRWTRVLHLETTKATEFGISDCGFLLSSPSQTLSSRILDQPPTKNGLQLNGFALRLIDNDQTDNPRSPPVFLRLCRFG